MAVNKETDRLPIEDSTVIKGKLETLLQERGMSAAALQRRINMTGGGWSKMWNNGTLTTGRLLSIAKALEVPAAMLLPDEHRGEVLTRKPGDRPYVEDRLEKVEQEVRSLRNELKKR